MPAKLNQPSLASVVTSFAAGIAVDRAEEPIDSLSRDWLKGIAALTGVAAPLDFAEAAATLVNVGRSVGFR